MLVRSLCGCPERRHDRPLFFFSAPFFLVGGGWGVVHFEQEGGAARVAKEGYNVFCTTTFLHFFFLGTESTKNLLSHSAFSRASPI